MLRLFRFATGRARRLMLMLATTCLLSAHAAIPVAADSEMLLVTNSNARHISLVDAARGVLQRIEVGALPWGMTLSRGRAYVATAEGVAVVDLAHHARVALVPYMTPVGTPAARFDDYRTGGEGIAASPDGRFVYVGVYGADGASRLEILDTVKLAMSGSVAVGQRPFQVLVARDGSAVYTVDHDSYSLTVIDARLHTTRRIELAAAGRGAFDKPHYAALLPDGRLLLPFSGKSLVFLDPRSGSSTSLPLGADTHQHGIALTPDGRRALIVGTGAYGTAKRGPSLTVFDVHSGAERILPLDRAHEQVVVSRDGKHAYLSGGFTFHDGWSGITVVDLENLAVTKEIPVPDLPLDIWLAH
jgi:DNA-binding beta-propeller fold protein YncE